MLFAAVNQCSASLPALYQRQFIIVSKYPNFNKTRLHSNPRQTTRECLYLVRRGHFRSRDKDGGDTNQTATSENHTLHINFTTPHVTAAQSLAVFR